MGIGSTAYAGNKVMIDRAKNKQCVEDLVKVVGNGQKDFVLIDRTCGAQMGQQCAASIAKGALQNDGNAVDQGACQL